MGARSDKRALRDFRAGAISVNDLLERLGAPRMEPEITPLTAAFDIKRRPGIFPMGARPADDAIHNDLSIDPADGRMEWYDAVAEDWRPVRALPSREGGIWIGEKGVSITGSIDADNISVSDTIKPEDPRQGVDEAPTWRADWNEHDAVGDDGLALLLWGRNASTWHSAHAVATAVIEAGWQRPDVDDDTTETLARILHGRDCREWRTAEEMAGLIERIGWTRYVIEPGEGDVGYGLVSLTEDEEAIVRWGEKRSADPVRTFNAILAARADVPMRWVDQPDEPGPEMGSEEQPTEEAPGFTVPPFTVPRIDIDGEAIQRSVDAWVRRAHATLRQALADAAKGPA